MDALVEFKGSLGKYKVVETDDKTKTLWSEYFDEACHNLSGAYEETLHNYIFGCNIPEQMTSSEDVHILDVGFGVGIGLKSIIEQVSKSSFISLKKLSYTSIELDEELFLWSMKHTLPFLCLTRGECNGRVSYTGEFTEAPHFCLVIKIYIGDGRLTLPAHKNELPPFTAIFQDAFSPKKNPTLWSIEWFHFLKDVSHPEVKLATYSSSISIRKSLVAAHWVIKNAKGFGQKRTMTIASLKGEIDPVLQNELDRSPILELRDK